MEATAKNVDRLVTVQMAMGSPARRSIIAPLYECACKKLGGKPLSLLAAKRMTNEVKTGDTVLLITGFGNYPTYPYGETDGPLGVASLARAVILGLDALPILVSGPRDMEAIRQTVKAAGVSVLEYSLAKKVNASTNASAAEITFPCTDKDESKRIATNILDEYSPKAIISVETVGPNNKGIKHRGGGADIEAEDKLPGLEYLFYEASARGILTIGVIDLGNELGSGTIEEDIRRITPNADMCKCPCKSGTACSVKTEIVFPAAVSNWGAYAITAMLGYLLKKPEILQDTYTERRMLEACIMAGATDTDGVIGGPIMSIDSINHRAHEALITMLHTITTNALLSFER